MTEKMKVLIVDDRKENLVALRQVLSELDAEIIEASSGNQALAKTLVHEFALAILDVQMPEMDGYELGELLRSDPKTAHLPVIFMTAALGDEIQVFKGYESGAVDYIVKPYNPVILLAKVRVFLDMQRARKELGRRVFALAASEERYRTLVATVPDIVYRIDPEGRFTFLNDAVTLLGYRPEELIGLPFSEIVFPEDVENISRRFVLNRFAGKNTGDEGAPKLFDERRTAPRQTIALEVRLVARESDRIVPAEVYNLDHPVLTAEVNSSGLYSSIDGRSSTFLGTVGIIRDITQRKKTEAELSRYRLRLETMVEERTVALSAANVKLREEIKERERSEKELVVSEARYRRLFEAAKDGILILDAETGIIFDVNPFLCEWMGFPSEHFIGKRLWELGFLEDVVDSQSNFDELKNMKYIRYDNLPMKTADGRRMAVEFISNVYQSGTRNVIQCNIRDITFRKQTEKQGLLTSEVLDLLNRKDLASDLVRDILKLIKNHTEFESVGIRLKEGEDFPYYETIGFSDDFVEAERFLCQRDTEGKIVCDEKGNPVLECMCGNVISGRIDPSLPFFTQGGSFWTNSTSMILSTTTEVDLQSKTRNRCNGEGYESVALIPLRAYGSIIGLLQLNDSRRNCFNLEMVKYFEGIGASIGIAMARKIAEKSLQESEERFRTIFELSTIGKSLITSDGRFLQVNKAFAHMLGYTVEELKGIHFQDVTHPDDITIGRECLRCLLANERSIFQMEKRYIHRNGSLVLTDYSTTLLRDGNGAPLYFISSILDITGRKLLEEQLLQSQKLEAVGLLSAGIAHDFNNILTTIIGNAELVVMDTGKEDPRREMVDEIKLAGEKAAGLIRQLLIFSRKQVIQPMLLNFNGVVKELEKMLRRIIGEDIELKIDLSPDLGRVEADMGQIEQVVMNLCVNAKDAMPKGGHLTIATQNVDLDEVYAKTHLSVSPGPYVMLTVSDSGTGMTSEVQSKLFQPFFTTKEQGKGTGLGLSTIYGIVSQSKGNIWVYSEPGKGSVFKIYLPRCDKISSAPKEVEDTTATLQGTETVLVVEDNEMVRKTTVKAVQRQGYTVLCAQDGREALRICGEHDGPIHLILTDVVMPGIGGSDMVDQAQALRPDMKVLFMSGYTDDAIVHHGVLEKGFAFLQKPFTTDRLARKIREVLNV